MHHTSSPPSLSDHDIDICYWPKGGGALLFVLFVHASTSAKKYEYISGKCFSLIVLSDIWFGKFSFCSPLAQRVHLCFNLVTYIMHFIMIHSCVNTGQWSGTHVALFPIADCILTTPSYHYQHPLSYQPAVCTDIVHNCVNDAPKQWRSAVTIKQSINSLWMPLLLCPTVYIQSKYVSLQGPGAGVRPV